MRIIGLILSLSFGSAFANTEALQIDESLKNAEALYAARDSTIAGVRAAEDAIKAYKEILPTVSGAQLINVVHHLGSLIFYRGEMLGNDSASNFDPDTKLPKTQLPKAQRKELFNECREHAMKLKLDASEKPIDVSDLKFTKIKDEYRTPFTYWYFLCTALWFKDNPESTKADRETLGNFLKAVIAEDTLELKEDLGVDTNYMAGGLKRAIAGSYINPLVGFILPGISTKMSRPKALEFITSATKSPGSKTIGDPIAGNFYISNFRVQINVLVSLDRLVEAKELSAKTIKRVQALIDNDELVAGYEPEIKHDLLLLNDQAIEKNLK